MSYTVFSLRFKIADASSRLASYRSRFADIKFGGNAPTPSERLIEINNWASASFAALNVAATADQSGIEFPIANRSRPIGPIEVMEFYRWWRLFWKIDTSLRPALSASPVLQTPLAERDGPKFPAEILPGSS